MFNFVSKIIFNVSHVAGAPTDKNLRESAYQLLRWAWWRRRGRRGRHVMKMDSRSAITENWPATHNWPTIRLILLTERRSPLLCQSLPMISSHQRARKMLICANCGISQFSSHDSMSASFARSMGRPSQLQPLPPTLNYFCLKQTMLMNYAELCCFSAKSFVSQLPRLSWDLFLAHNRKKCLNWLSLVFLLSE
jgi:hypothetical protein